MDAIILCKHYKKIPNHVINRANERKRERKGNIEHEMVCTGKPAQTTRMLLLIIHEKKEEMAFLFGREIAIARKGMMK